MPQVGFAHRSAQAEVMTDTAIRPKVPGLLKRRWPAAAGLVIGGLGLAGSQFEAWSPTTFLLPVIALVYLMFGVLRRLETAGFVAISLVVS
jgi:hypothetical protein